MTSLPGESGNIAADLDDLRAIGVTHLVNRPDAGSGGSGLAFVEAAVAGGGRAVLHCWAGLGRAGTLMACILVHQGMAADDAIVTTRWVRPGAIQSNAQLAAIHFAATLIVDPPP